MPETQHPPPPYAPPAPPAPPARPVPASPPGGPSAAPSLAPPAARDGAAERHIPALDGLRGLAILFVMVFHFGRPPVEGTGPAVIRRIAEFGWTGVELFFVLSGFLITGILLHTRAKPGYFRSFYLRRTLRIFPLYFAFVGLYVYLIAPNLPGQQGNLAERQGWLWTYLVNFDIARQGWFPGTGSHANNLWSLAIEEQFYLVFPLIVWLLPTRALKVVVVAMIAASALGRFALEILGQPPRVGYLVTPTRLDGLGLGALLAIVAREPGGLGRFVTPARVLAPLGVVAAVAVALRVGSFDLAHWRVLQFGMPALSLTFASILVLGVAPGGSALVRRALEGGWLQFLGRYSYGIYMWHALMGRLVAMSGGTPRVLGELLPGGTAVVVAIFVLKVAVAIVAALVSYAVIERPFLLLKDRLARRPA